MEQKVLLLNPHFTHNIWGGTRLREQFGYQIEGNDIGECWGIAAHPNGEAVVREGSFAGQKLTQLWEQHRELFGMDTAGKRFPLLVKIIDAKQDLSIQVHPDDVYAGIHEQGSLGKMECWYILDCCENAELVIGHNASDKEELCHMIQEGRWQELIHRIPVKKGDFIQINPGTIHAITAGILLLETQQNSDITYRVYDYDRLSNGKPRPLHVKQSIDVITVPSENPQKFVKEAADIPPNAMYCMYKCKYYTVYRLGVKGKFVYERIAPFLLCSVVDGEGRVGESVVHKGDHFLIPNTMEHVEFTGDMELVISHI